MNAVIYARYSSDNQREESIEGQVREYTAFAERKGYMVLKIDDFNGKGVTTNSGRKLTYQFINCLLKKQTLYRRIYIQGYDK